MDHSVTTLRKIADCLSLDAAITINLNAVSERIAEGLGCPRSFVLVYRSHAERLVASASFGLSSAGFRKLEAGVEGGLFAEVFERTTGPEFIRFADQPALSFLNSDDVEDLS